MKIQCDVCNKDEATLFCVADEAALCVSCDHKVHHANKLAGKHQRFSLLHPSSKQIPLCDICQEERAFLFCQQDRAILCKDCDISIHKSNEHTQKHNRFLLSGVKLSEKTTLYSASSSSCSSPASAIASPVSSTNSQSNIATFDVPTVTPGNIIKKPLASTYVPPTKPVAPTVDAVSPTQPQGYNGQAMGDLTSSISEYLIETLPGWHVEDFLDLSSTTSNGFSKAIENEIGVQQFWNVEDMQHSLPAENASLWVPQVTPTNPIFHTISPIQTNHSSGMAFGAQMGFKESKGSTELKPNRKRKDENSYAVPQICPSSGLRKSRTSW
ncbi:hypothetical protein Leryth_014705 [Lithospermum erythrorhizon]|nr:hypothetical protein Leryth_014705 [Lithospermum erythrorhizon]